MLSSTKWMSTISLIDVRKTVVPMFLPGLNNTRLHRTKAHCGCRAAHALAKLPKLNLLHSSRKRPDSAQLRLFDRPIPFLDRRDPLIITENVQSPSIKKKMTPDTRRESQPARRNHPQQVAVGEERDVSLLATRSGDDAISTVTHLLRCLAARAAVFKQQPPWDLLVNLTRCHSFVFAVIPLHQIVVDLRGSAQPAKFTGLPGALKRAG